MRTESFRRGLISISLIFTLVLSMILTAPLAIAPAVIFEPGGTTIEVVQDQEFILRFRLRWDMPGAENLGYFSLAVNWSSPGENGTPSENFTFLGAEAYFDLDGDDLPDDENSYITVDYLEFIVGVVAGNASYTVVASHTIGDNRDGEFNVDLKFSAAGIGGVAHIAGDHTISIVTTIDVNEGDKIYAYSPPDPTITVHVLGRGVAVAISPSKDSGPPGETLTYTVTVTNTGDVADNYDLDISDNAGWGLSLDNIRFEDVENGGSRSTTLRVTIPSTALPSQTDNITVTATSQGDTTVRDNASCIARAVVAPPKLLTPSDGTLTDDNTPTFEWTVSANADNHWLLVDNDSGFTSPEENVLLGATDNTYTISAPGLADENYSWKVRAYSRADFSDSEVWTFLIDTLPPAKPTLVWPTDGEDINDNTPNLGWEAVIDPSGVTYDVQVDNDSDFSPPIENDTGVVDENYQVTVELAEGTWYWRVRAVDGAGNIGSWESGSFTVSITRGVDVSISPSYQSGLPGATLSYTVIVTNEGALEDTYSLTVSDNASPSWGPTILNNSLTIPAGENRATTLNVTIPSDVALGTEDNITVTATGTGVENSATCVAYAARVIYPIHDAYVWQREKDTNYNTDNLKIGVEADGSIRAWLRFDLSGIPFGHRVESARLRLYFHDSVDGGAPGGIAAHFSNDDSWLEGEITWNDQPPFDDAASDSIPQFTDIGWKSLTLTQDVKRELDGDKNVSLCLKSSEDGDGYNIARSKEYENVLYHPYLEVVYVPFYGVSITSISPPENSARPGENVTFTVTVKNMGAFEDNYVLTISDNLWPTTISPTELKSIASEASKTATLSVTVPENALGSTEDDITVKATSAGDPTASHSAACIARAATVRGVEVSISPSEGDGVPGTTLSYTVIVRNTGNVADNYALTVSDNAGWSLSLSENRFDNVAPDEDKTTTLNVMIPGDAAHCTRDNVTITATSQADNMVSDSDSCIAHAAIVRGVRVSISPGHKSDVPGETLTYTVTVTNTGNVADNYKLTKSDNAVPSWNPTVSPTSLTITAGESDTATLSVTIPSGAEHGERDNIRVVAASMENAEVSASASCEAEASILRRVEVSISPGSGSGPPGTSLTYIVTVRNAGLMDDNYTLRAVGAAGWSVSIEPDSLILAAGTSDNATLTVTIPEDAENGTSMTTNVSVKSEGDPTVIETDSCRTVVTGVPEGPKVELPVPLAISVVLIGAVIIVPAYLLRGRPKKAARRRVLRDVSLGPRY